MSTQSHRKIRGALPYPWPADESANMALLVIDMQRDFCEEGGYITNQGLSYEPCRSVIQPIMRLLEAFERRNLPIYFTREGHRPDLSTLSDRELLRSRNNPSEKGIGDPGTRLGRSLVRGEPGHEIIDELEKYVLTGHSNVIDKPGRSAFAHTELDLILRLKAIRNLVICGVTTDVCVHSTMREANDRGYDCLLVEDASAAGTTRLHEFAVDSIRGEGGIFGSVATVSGVLRCLELEGGDPGSR